MADLNLVLSDSVKVFPCGNRDPLYNRDSKYTTEHNLISMVNKLVDRDSFVVSYEKSSGWIVFNLHGYLFQVDVEEIVNSFGASVDWGDIEKKYVYAAIAVGNNNVGAGDTISELLPLGLDLPTNASGALVDKSLLDFGTYKEWDDKNGDGIVDDSDELGDIKREDSKFYGVQFIRWGRIENVVDGALLDDQWNNIDLSSSQEKDTIFAKISAVRSQNYVKYVLPILKLVSYNSSKGEIEFEVPEESKVRLFTDCIGNHRAVIIDDGVLYEKSGS